MRVLRCSSRFTVRGRKQKACKAEGALIRKAVDASLDANVRTPEIQVEGGEKFGTKEVGAWIVDYIRKA